MIPFQGTAVNYKEIGQLPPFNPDLDYDEVDIAVFNWRNHLKESDGVLICTQEYAKGVPGSLKNAFDWVISSEFEKNSPVLVRSMGRMNSSKISLFTLDGNNRVIQGKCLELLYQGK
jgi:chromate reductase, NAD(P)H dehydrogenase (quinone)